MNTGKRKSKLKRSAKRIAFYILGLGIVVSALLYLFFSTRKVEARWFDEAWLYRTPINVSQATGGTLTNFQVSVTVDTDGLYTAGKIQADCDDIRFVDRNGAMLPYWLEDITDASDANSCSSADSTFWVKIPSIPSTSSGVIIYMYYGNANGYFSGSL